MGDLKMVETGGQKKRYAVLGHPIGHTLSPVMHNEAFRALGWNATYEAIDVPPEKLMGEIAALQKAGFAGLNLTIPLKEVAARNLSKLDESAQLMGAVNTVRFTPEGPVGYNTDGAGFLMAFEEAFGCSVSGKSLFVLGTGGAGRAVALACAGAGIVSVTLADRCAELSHKVAMEIETQFFISNVSVVSDPEEQLIAARKADIVVQATPVGMKTGDASPLGKEAFRDGQFAFDLIYMYPETPFMKAAREGGARAANGLGMLLHQGAKAFEIWTGVVPPVDVMRKALEQAVYT